MSIRGGEKNFMKSIIICYCLAMNDLTIRDLTAADAAQIRGFFLNPVFHFLVEPESPYPFAETDIAAAIDSAIAAKGIACGNELVGSAILKKEDNAARLSFVYIDRRYRGQSLSKRLIRAALKEYNGAVEVFTLKGQREHELLFSELGFTKTSDAKSCAFEETDYTFFRWVYGSSTSSE